jgi:hypothetical protein
MLSQAIETGDRISKDCIRRKADVHEFADSEDAPPNGKPKTVAFFRGRKSKRFSVIQVLTPPTATTAPHTHGGMHRKLQLVLALCAATVITALISHIVVAWLKIETTTGKPWKIGPVDKPLAFMAGSSLAANGISWGDISTDVGLRIGGWGVAGSSPWEWEIFQQKPPPAQVTFLVVSIYDLNEQFLCDFHADVVPLVHTVNDLRRSRADWHFSKRVLSQYPLNYVRVLFPTVGRSDGVMWGMRDQLSYALRLSTDATSESRPTLSVGKSTRSEDSKKGTIRDWEPARMLRRLASMRVACQGRHSFDGPKNLAFLRMLRQGQQQGRVVVVVLPVSRAYSENFVTARVSGDFEKALANARQLIPEAQWVRLDRLPNLNSNGYFWDLVHMNTNGQQIATQALLSHLRASSDSH